MGWYVFAYLVADGSGAAYLAQVLHRAKTARVEPRRETGDHDPFSDHYEDRRHFVQDVDRLVDPATGLSGEWHFDIVLDFVFPIAHRGVTLTLVLFRIDDGTWSANHPKPDQVVTDLGSTLRSVTRNSDVIARFGEDTFICLLPLCNIQGGLVFADRMRDALEDFTSRTGTTVSAAVASTLGDGEGTQRDMVRALKGALAEAQSQGGDRVELPADGWNV